MLSHNQFIALTNIVYFSYFNIKQKRVYKKRHLLSQGTFNMKERKIFIFLKQRKGCEWGVGFG